MNYFENQNENGSANGGNMATELTLCRTASATEGEQSWRQIFQLECRHPEAKPKDLKKKS